MESVVKLKEKFEPDMIIANAENSAGGAGLTAKIATQLRSSGIDAITLGDHVWDQPNFQNEIDDLPFVCRPTNLPETNPGRSSLVIEKSGFKLGIFTVLGRNFMKVSASCPFLAADESLKAIEGACDAVFVEAHMEATSEKIALGWHLDGRVCAVVGTHTHVATADERILEKGTAYLTDAGMCGPFRSVLGREVEPVVATFTDGMKRRFPVANSDIRLSGCLITYDELARQTVAIERFQIVLK